MLKMLERSKLHLFTVFGAILIVLMCVGIPAETQVLFLVAVPVFLALVYAVSNWQITVMFALFATTLNGAMLPIGNAILKPENSALLLGVGAFLLFALKNRAKIVTGAEVLLFMIYIGYTIYISDMLSPVWSDSVAGIIQLIVAFLGFFLVIQLRESGREKIRRYVLLYAGVFVFQTLYGIISFALYVGNGINIGGVMQGQEGHSITMKGTLLEANLFGTFAGAALIVLITLLVSGSLKRNFLWSVCSIILFVGLIASWTRSAWIGFVIGLLIVGVVYVKEFIKPKTIAVILITTFLIILPLFAFISGQLDGASGESGMFVSKLTNLVDTSDGSTGAYRLNQFSIALDDLKGHEMTGKGYYSIKRFGEEAWISNLFLFIYHDTGVIGLLIFVPILLIVIGRAISFIRKNTGKDKAYMVGLLGGLVLILFCFNFTPGHVLGMFWVYLGLVAAYSQTKN